MRVRMVSTLGTVLRFCAWTLATAARQKQIEPETRGHASTTKLHPALLAHDRPYSVGMTMGRHSLSAGAGALHFTPKLAAARSQKPNRARQAHHLPGQVRGQYSKKIGLGRRLPVGCERRSARLRPCVSQQTTDLHCERGSWRCWTSLGLLARAPSLTGAGLESDWPSAWAPHAPERSQARAGYP